MVIVLDAQNNEGFGTCTATSSVDVNPRRENVNAAPIVCPGVHSLLVGIRGFIELGGKIACRYADDLTHVG